MVKKIEELKTKIDVFGEKNYNILVYIAFGLLFFHCYNCSFRHIIYPNQLVLFGSYFVTGVCLFVANSYKINKSSIIARRKFIILSLILILLIIFRNGDISNGHYGVPFYSVFCVLMIIVLSFNDRWYNIAKNVLMFFVAEHVIATIFCYLCPNFYKDNILPLFPNYQKELLFQFERKQIAGITQHYSTNALYLVTGIIASFSNLKLDFKKEKLKSCLQILFLVLIALSLLLTGKRSQVFFPVVALLAVFMLKNRKNLFEAVKKISIVFGISLIGVLILANFIPTITTSFDRIIRTVTSENIAGNREPLYDLAIAKFKEKPIVGWGWANYKYIYRDTVVVKERNTMEAHCIYLQLLSEVGIIGTIFVCSLLAYLLIKAFKIILKLKDSDKLNYCYWFLGFHIYFLLEGIFGNSIYDIPIFIPYSVICGGFMYIHYFEKNKKNIRKK